MGFVRLFLYGLSVNVFGSILIGISALLLVRAEVAIRMATAYGILQMIRHTLDGVMSLEASRQKGFPSSRKIAAGLLFAALSVLALLIIQVGSSK
jgi:hypothetical protein